MSRRPPPRGLRPAIALFGALMALGAIFTFVGTGRAADAEALIRHNNLGIAYLAQYKPSEAEAEFRRAIAIDPRYVPAHVNAGIASLAQVHYDRAMEAFEAALRLDPDNIYAHFNLSLIHKLQGRADEALATARRALALDSRDPDVRYHVGSLHLTRREYDDAIREFDAVLKLDPNFLSAYYSLGRAWMAKGNVEKGKEFIQKHKDMQSGAGATPAVGLRYGEQGKYSYAMEDTGGAGEVAPLAPGAVTLVDVTESTGLAFRHAAEGSLDSLRKPASGGRAEDWLRRTMAPLLGAGVAAGDVNGDGRVDLFFPNASPDGRAVSELWVQRGPLQFERAPLEDPDGAPLVRGRALSGALGDLDSDADLDLVVSMDDRILVLTNDGGGRFTPAPADAIPALPVRGILGGVTLADIDHDGDLDIHVAGLLGVAESVGPFPDAWPGAPNHLLINATGAPIEGQGAAPLKFIAAPPNSGIGGRARRSPGAVFSDFDNDRDIDFALASPGEGTTVFSNQRDATFRPLGAAAGLPANARILGLAVGDYDKDGWMDLAATTWDSGLPRLFRNMMARSEPGGAGAFALDVNALADVPRQIAEPQFGVAFLDIDNDGALDLVTVNGSDVGPALFVFRNAGEGRFIDASDLTGASRIPARGGRGLVAADLDADGDLDLVIANAGHAPTILRNDGSSRNHWIRIETAGLHSNTHGVGAKVEIKSGRLWQKQEVTAGSGWMSQSPAALHFGLGPRERIDTVRVLWPGGVLQDEVQVAADARFAVKELDRKGSSCPILYAWNGSGMAFVSDFLGGSAVGYRTGPDSFNHPDTDEYVKIDGARLVPKDGRLELRLVNQLEETIFYDRALLLAVDHPRQDDIWPDERLMPAPPFPDFRIHVVRDPRPLAAAVTDDGVDRTDALARVDRRYVEPPSPLTGRRFRGYAPPHALTLDLGPVAPEGPLVLLLHGWIDYADSTSNLAASQAGLVLIPPILEALDEDDPAGDDRVVIGGRERRGRWVPAVDPMGFPAGLPKTMTVDLTGRLPRDARIVRIRTSMRIHWDRILVADAFGPSPRVTPVEATRAELRFRGFPAIVLPDGRRPEEYDYASDQERVHWKVQSGAFTRHGDVLPLLAAVDDRYVITSPGDEIAISFPAADLPPIPEGWTRDWLLYTDGFGKDMDLNAARPHTVGPLPWHGMTEYPPRDGGDDPIDRAGHLDYQIEYNTREVRSPLPPLRGR